MLMSIRVKFKFLPLLKPEQYDDMKYILCNKILDIFGRKPKEIFYNKHEKYIVYEVFVGCLKYKLNYLCKDISYLVEIV
jgi:hypothetical protein